MKYFLITCEGAPGLIDGVDAMGKNSDALDVIESLIKPIERDESIRSVSYNAMPNLAGQMELDASIIDGNTLEVGSVGALQGYMNPISIARSVINGIPHAMLVGEGAAQFAKEQGYQKETILSDQAAQDYRNWLDTDNREELLEAGKFTELSWQTCDPITAGGTVVALVSDCTSKLAAGASTSGWSWKHPGRLGDTPVIGAGIYADSRYGAAGCIGHGEIAIRSAASHKVIMKLEQGKSLNDALLYAAEEIQRIKKSFSAWIAIHGVDTRGNHQSICLGKGIDFYYFWKEGQKKPEKFSAKMLAI
jgi:L-asparaginase / beta-aspartyl-peptidase